MIFALVLSLAVQGSNPPVTVQLNHDQFSSGDRARVYVQTAQDGYLVVLHADADGRVRVLFPIDPSDDDFIRGGRKFELRARNDRDAFQVYGDEGSGVVLAAYSTDPFKYDAFVNNDHWDFRALGGVGTVRDDPLAKLLDIVHRMSGDSTGSFEYDQATYVVRSSRYASRYGSGYDYPWRFGIGWSFGYPFFYNPFCDPFWGCYGLGFRYRYGFGYPFGYGFGYPFGYGFGYPFGYGYGYIFRPRLYRPRPFVFDNFGRRFGSAGTGFVMPRGRERVTPIPVRPRMPVTQPTPIRNRDIQPRVFRPEPRMTGQPRVNPGRGPGAGQARGWSRGASRGWSGGASRPMARPSNGSGGGGGRRH